MQKVWEVLALKVWQGGRRGSERCSARKTGLEITGGGEGRAGDVWFAGRKIGRTKVTGRREEKLGEGS